jgi:uncharacterized protein
MKYIKAAGYFAQMKTFLLFGKMVLVLTLIFFLNSNNSQAQNSNTAITIGKKDSLFSKTLNEKREFWVSVPSEFRPDISYKKFPVVVLLDGDVHFFSTLGLIDRFSTNIGNEQCPPMIIVGLINTDRIRDFNPTFENDSFAVFLKDELLPYIDNNYPTEPYRMLIGHSIAGLRVVHTAIYNNKLFNSYLAIDPSLGHERNKWYEHARKDIEKFNLGKNRMYIGMGQTMPYKMQQDTTSIKKDTSGYSNHMRRIMEFSETMLKKNTTNDKKFEWKFHPNETHQSLTQLVIYDGISFLFNWYKITNLSEILDPETSPQNALKLLKDYYEKISNNLGYTVIPPENSTMIWYLFEYKKQKEKAYAIAEYNLTCHPDNKEAIELFKKIKKDLNR